MKFFAATATLALAASTANGAACDFGKIAADLGPVVGPASLCQAATQFTIIPPVALPTADQVKSICSKCTDLITAAKTVTFPTCTLTIAGTEISIDKLFNQIAGQCDGAAAGSNGTTTAPAAGANATEAPAATTAAPDATTAAPMEEGSVAGSTAGSQGSEEDIKTPAETTAKPDATPAPTKSAGVSATLGAAVAVACSIAAFVL